VTLDSSLRRKRIRESFYEEVWTYLAGRSGSAQTELLEVVAIMAILVGMLLPSLRRCINWRQQEQSALP